MPGWYFAYAQIELNLRILRMLEGTFVSLFAAHIAYKVKRDNLEVHYENKPIQIYRKFYHQNMKIFR